VPAVPLSQMSYASSKSPLAGRVDPKVLVTDASELISGASAKL
jgi:hypothetical protein